jgi:hypothetical protein
MLLANQRTATAFELSNRGVRVEADNQKVAEFPGALEIIHVAIVEEVETAVRRHNPLSAVARGRRPSGRLYHR